MRATTLVPQLWPESTIVCIASGPSLTQADVDFVHGKARVIVVNNTHLLAPWADVLWATDAEWWDHYHGVPSFQGLKFSLQVDGYTATYPDVHIVKNTGRPGLSLDRGAVANGFNGGHAAMNLARHLGARKIVLLGYDCQLGLRGETHWHGDHPREIRKALLFEEWKRYFETIVPPLSSCGIDIVNCSRSTALTGVPWCTLSEAFAPMAMERAS